MAAIPPEVTDPVASAIFAAWKRRGDAQTPRTYIGASVIGKPCARALWLDFRWCGRPEFSGRMYRLFDRGQREEAAFVADLQAIGMTVYEVDPATGQQFSFSDLGGHLGGHCDGIATGLPQAPKSPAILEFKTHSSKSFAALKKDGVQKAKPEHWAQCQLYQHWTIEQWGEHGCRQALYVAVNKDTDDIYTERIKYDKDAAEALIAKAKAIITSGDTPPEKIGGPDWYECKWCHYYELCHGTKVPAPNCRNCAYASAKLDGNKRWTCDKHGCDLGAEQQAKGCHEHRFIPALLGNFATPHDFKDGKVIYMMKDGSGQFSNGDLGSDEIAALQDKASLPNLLADPSIKALREQFGGRIVG
jgi:CRISPR/Cas system-associated exonuclease Cas4 (RecB family)